MCDQKSSKKYEFSFLQVYKSPKAWIWYVVKANKDKKKRRKTQRMDLILASFKGFQSDSHFGVVPSMLEVRRSNIMHERNYYANMFFTFLACRQLNSSLLNFQNQIPPKIKFMFFELSKKWNPCFLRLLSMFKSETHVFWAFFSSQTIKLMFFQLF